MSSSSIDPPYLLTVDNAAKHILTKTGSLNFPIIIGIITGSGSKDLFDATFDSKTFFLFELADLNFPQSTIPGHSNHLIIRTKWSDQCPLPVAILAGRVHYYEGYEMPEVGMGARLLCKLGVKYLILCNASGGIDLGPGTFAVIRDHVAFPILGGQSSLRIKRKEGGAQLDSSLEIFPATNQVYDRQALKLVKKAAAIAGLHSQIVSTIYAMSGGPSYETPTELRLMKMLGVGAVGMSTVPEVLIAAQHGIQVCVIALITNRCCYEDKKISYQDTDNENDDTQSIESKCSTYYEPSHEEVLQVAKENARTLNTLLGYLVPVICEAKGFLDTLK